MHEQVDVQTLEALKAGDHKAFETIFLAYYPHTKDFLYGYMKSEPDAEELAEELFVNLWIKRHQIDTTRQFAAYLHTIARHAAINYLKHKYVREVYADKMASLEYTATSEEELIAKELGLLIEEVVDRMPKQRKQIYLLSRNEGLSNAEIAARLNTTRRNVESQLSLALKEIRKVISVFLLFIC